MSFFWDKDKHLKRYLLGQLNAARQRRLEERLLTDAEMVERLPLVEDDLIDSYVFNELSPRDRQSFENHFICLPERQKRLRLAQALRQISKQKARSIAPIPSPVTPPAHPFARIERIFATAWKPAVAFLLLISVSVAGWFYFRRYSEWAKIREAEAELSQITRGQRPFEMRITNTAYAPHILLSGDDKRQAALSIRQTENKLILLADKTPNAASRHLLGRFYLFQKDLDNAIAQLKDALKDDPNNPRIYNDLAVAYRQKATAARQSNNVTQSEEYLGQCHEYLLKARELDDSIPEVLFNLASHQQTQGLLNEARKTWKRYLEVETNPDWKREGEGKLAELEKQLEKTSQSQKILYQDFVDAHKNGDDKKAWESLSRSRLWTGSTVVGTLIDSFLEHSAAKRNDEANEKLKLLIYAGELDAREAKDPFTQELARYYQNTSERQRLSLVQSRRDAKSAYDLYNQSKLEEAIKFFDNVKKNFERVGNRWEALIVDYAIGHCFYQLRGLGEGLSTFETLARICEENDFRWLLTLSFNGFINVYVAFNEYSKALDYSVRAMAMSKQIGDSNGLMRSYFHLSNLNRLFGKYHESLDFTQEGLKLAQQLSLATDQVLQLQVTAAQDNRAIGLNYTALDYQKEALHFALQTKVPLIISRAYVQLGRIHGLLHNFTKAAVNIEKGFKIGEEKRDERSGKDIMGYASLHFADYYRDLGNLNQSMTSYNQAINFYSQTNLKHLLFQAYKGKTLSALALKDYATIQTDIPKLLELFEELRVQTLEEGNRNSLFNAEQNVCDGLIDFTYSKTNNSQLALSYSETCRARSLLDIIGANPQILQDNSLPDLRITVTAKPMEPQQICGALPHNVQIVQYDVLEDKILIWVVSHNGISPVKVDISIKNLNEAVANYSQLVSDPQSYSNEEIRRRGIYLYDLLVKPVEHLLDKQKLICIVPDKALNYLPFGTLISSDTSEYLVEKIPMVFSPSSNVFLLLTNAARKKSLPRFERLLSVGNPRFSHEDFPSLPDLLPAREQAEQIIGYYPSRTLLTEEKAREKQVRAEMEKADVIHFATHYVTDDRSPMLSKLLLTKEESDPAQIEGFDGILQPFEIYRMKLSRTRLVVLSACQTGVEKYYQGEGMIGMARPFLAAEVPLVVASLWAVDATATKELMVKFHRNRKTRPISTVEALRQAQIEMLHHPISHYRNPYFWASFVVIGGYAEF